MQSFKQFCESDVISFQKAKQKKAEDGLAKIAGHGIEGLSNKLDSNTHANHKDIQSLYADKDHYTKTRSHERHSIETLINYKNESHPIGSALFDKHKDTIRKHLKSKLDAIDMLDQRRIISADGHKSISKERQYWGPLFHKKFNIVASGKKFNVVGDHVIER